jgi:hypothetical protein
VLVCSERKVLPADYLWLFCSERKVPLAGGWCWFVPREKYCRLITGGCFVLRGKYRWLVADKPSEQGTSSPCRSVWLAGGS